MQCPFRELECDPGCPVFLNIEDEHGCSIKIAAKMFFTLIKKLDFTVTDAIHREGE
ncbi:MAG: hypothetical protein ACWGQW_00450 [bacterium]